MSRKRLWSVFTDNMNECILTGYEDPEGTPFPMIERHHVFGGPNRSLSEKYGYVAPLRRDLHPNGVLCDGKLNGLDLILKQACQLDYEANYGSREDFIREFGRNYLDEVTPEGDPHRVALTYLENNIPRLQTALAV